MGRTRLQTLLDRVAGYEQELARLEAVSADIVDLGRYGSAQEALRPSSLASRIVELVVGIAARTDADAVPFARAHVERTRGERAAAKLTTAQVGPRLTAKFDAGVLGRDRIAELQRDLARDGGLHVGADARTYGVRVEGAVAAKRHGISAGQYRVLMEMAGLHVDGFPEGLTESTIARNGLDDAWIQKAFDTVTSDQRLMTAALAASAARQPDMTL